MNASSEDRRLAAAALRANPVVVIDADMLPALEDPGCDLSFEEIGMDSMARMELSIWLELELGIEATEEMIREIGSVAGLAQFIAARRQAR
jgi:acyl carrier protein